MRLPNRLLKATFALLIALQIAGAQSRKVALPTVANAKMPLYPPLARAARVQGVVRVRVTTDGHRVVSAAAESGPKILAAAAQDVAHSWQFATHEPTSFIVTFTYKLVNSLKSGPENPTVVLRLPTEVEVSMQYMPALDSGAQ
jgi:Gram-negative bacterial TonB protein C-terminal